MTGQKITLKKDLTDVKIADKKKLVMEIIKKWRIQVEYREFRDEFLSTKHDKYFNDIKKIIGDFKGIPKMSVLNFLAQVILGRNSKYKVIKELQEEFIKMKGRKRR